MLLSPLITGVLVVAYAVWALTKAPWSPRVRGVVAALAFTSGVALIVVVVIAAYSWPGGD